MIIFSGETSIHKSIDTTVELDDVTKYPAEVLNSIEVSGLSQHRLELKVGCPVMLLRNFDAPR